MCAAAAEDERRIETPTDITHGGHRTPVLTRLDNILKLNMMGVIKGTRLMYKNYSLDLAWPSSGLRRRSRAACAAWGYFVAYIFASAELA